MKVTHGILSILFRTCKVYLPAIHIRKFNLSLQSITLSSQFHLMSCCLLNRQMDF